MRNEGGIYSLSFILKKWKVQRVKEREGVLASLRQCLCHPPASSLCWLFSPGKAGSHAYHPFILTLKKQSRDSSWCQRMSPPVCLLTVRLFGIFWCGIINLTIQKPARHTYRVSPLSAYLSAALAVQFFFPDSNLDGQAVTFKWWCSPDLGLIQWKVVSLRWEGKTVSSASSIIVPA